MRICYLVELIIKTLTFRTLTMIVCVFNTVESCEQNKNKKKNNFKTNIHEVNFVPYLNNVNVIVYKKKQYFFHVAFR